MAHIFVSGLLNTETTVQVNGFPIPYFPIDYPSFGVGSWVSGVGFNLSKALLGLGDELSLASLLGDDLTARLIREKLASLGIDDRGVLTALDETPSSVVLCEPGGRREIYCDLKDIQQKSYPFRAEQIAQADAVLACNINFNRPLLALARAQGKLIATDVHVLSNPDDDYNRDFMAAADVLFLSDEGVGWDKEGFLRALAARYHNRVLVMGMGAQGALLYEPAADRVLIGCPAWQLGEVKSTVGAGDAFFACFMHYYCKGLPCAEALDRAQLFAAMKIRAVGAPNGLATEAELEEEYAARRR